MEAECPDGHLETTTTVDLESTLVILHPLIPHFHCLRCTQMARIVLSRPYLLTTPTQKYRLTLQYEESGKQCTYDLDIVGESSHSLITTCEKQLRSYWNVKPKSLHPHFRLTMVGTTSLAAVML